MATLAAFIVALAGYVVPVQCAPTSGSNVAGTIYFDGGNNATLIVLAPEVCDATIAALTGTHSTPVPGGILIWTDAQEGAALMTTIHEAQHAHLHSRDELRVECKALDLFRVTAWPYAHDFAQLTAWEHGAWASHLATLPVYQGDCLAAHFGALDGGT